MRGRAGVSRCGTKLLTLLSAARSGMSGSIPVGSCSMRAAQSPPRNPPPTGTGDRHLQSVGRRLGPARAAGPGSQPRLHLPVFRAGPRSVANPRPAALGVSWSSLTGRPLQAFRTPLITLSRLNGSTTPASDELHLLDGGEPPLTRWALTPAADASPIVSRPRVEHLGVGVATVRAVHCPAPSPDAPIVASPPWGQIWG